MYDFKQIQTCAEGCLGAYFGWKQVYFGSADMS